MKILKSLSKIQTRNKKILWFLKNIIEELQQVNIDYYNSIYNIEHMQLILKDKKEDAQNAINTNDTLIENLLTTLESEADIK